MGSSDKENVRCVRALGTYNEQTTATAELEPDETDIVEHGPSDYTIADVSESSYCEQYYSEKLDRSIRCVRDGE